MALYIGDYEGDRHRSNLVYFEDDRLIGAARGNRFIHTAAFAGDPEVFRLVQSAFPDLAVENDLGLSPPEIAAAALNTRVFADMADLDRATTAAHADRALYWVMMRLSGYERNLVGATERTGIVADIDLTDASGAKYIATLLDLGANPDSVWEGGVTPLQLAAETGLPAIGSTLLRAGADANLQPADSALAMPLALAAESGSTDLATALLNRAPRWTRAKSMSPGSCVPPSMPAIPTF